MSTKLSLPPFFIDINVCIYIKSPSFIIDASGYYQKLAMVATRKTVAPAKDGLIILLLHSKGNVKYSVHCIPTNEESKKPFHPPERTAASWAQAQTQTYTRIKHTHCNLSNKELPGSTDNTA